MPDEVRRFVARCVHSVAEMEALVALQRERGRSWTDAELAPVLGAPPDEAGRILFDLMARGLLRLTNNAPLAYRYDPRDPEVRRAADTLAALQATRRAAVLDLVASRPRESLRLFADAFRVRPAPRRDQRRE